MLFVSVIIVYVVSYFLFFSIFSSECAFSTPWPLGAGNPARDYDFCHGSSSIMTRNEFFYHASTSNRVDDGDDFDSSFAKDDEINENDACKSEEFEVRMDLTDDLLHMVCISKDL